KFSSNSRDRGSSGVQAVEKIYSSVTRRLLRRDNVAATPARSFKASGTAHSTMRRLARTLATCALAGGIGAALVVMARPPAGRAPSYRAPRLADGRPDLNGIWQALNEANYDIEAHIARPAMALRAGPYGPLPAATVLALGAVGAVPPGLGVVDGGEIPYRPDALKQRQENRKNWLTADPEIKCYLPGVPRAPYMPHPFHILQSTKAIFIAYQYAGAVRDVYLKDPGPPPVDSWMGQQVGRWAE